MTEPPSSAEPVQIFVPDELEAGVFAHGVSASASPDDIVLDFMVNVPGPTARLRVVSRVRLPPSQMLEIMKHLGDLLASWEARFGKVPRPGVPDAPDYPPDDVSG